MTGSRPSPSAAARPAAPVPAGPRLAGLVLAGLCAAAAAQGPPAADPPPIAFPSVAAALAALQARDGDGTVVTHQEGWVVINEPLAAAQWSFVPREHPAHPALVRRVVVRSADGRARVHSASLCEAPRAACDALVAEFDAVNERIAQALSARGRKGPSLPLPAAPAASR